MKLQTQMGIRKSWFEIFYITAKTNIDAVDMKKLWIMKIEWRNFENESVVTVYSFRKRTLIDKWAMENRMKFASITALLRMQKFQ